MTKVLIIEDDQEIASFIQRGLQSDGYEANAVGNGAQALKMIEAEFDYDLVILDIMLPEVDGLTLLEKLRAKDATLPVLILSAKRSVDERILGLKRGGDDYITKPFSYSELLVRVQVLLRRVAPKTQETQAILSAYDVTMNLITRTVTREGKTIELQTKEFGLLEIFIRHRDRVLSRTSLLEFLYGYHFDPQTNVVDVLIHRLRKKLNAGFEKELIVNIRGTGYVFK